MAEIKQLAGPQSRRRFLAVGGGSTALAAFLAACGSDSSSTTGTTAMKPGGKSETAEFGKGDVGILNYALTLEYLRRPSTRMSSRAASSRELTWRRSASSAARRPNMSKR